MKYGLLTWILYCFLSTFSYAEQIEPSYLAVLKSCSDTVYPQIKTILSTSYQRIKKEKRVYSWEMEDRHSRIPHYCIEQCGCMAEEYAKDLKAELKDKIEISGLRISGGAGLLPVEIIHEGNKAAYQYHEALMIRWVQDNCYMVADPIMLDTGLVNTKIWLTHIPSIADNNLYLWKR